MGFFSEYKQVTQLLQQRHPVVFYAESRHYYSYFEQLINDILANSNTAIYYITSDAKDPLLVNAPDRVKVVYVKWMLGFLFARLRADVVIMTMPDLDNFLFKRSKEVSAYIYVFHAAVSTHQQYRQKAFFHYDVIFCTGDYQAREIRAAEKLYQQKEKKLISYGYPLLDAIKRKVAENSSTSPATILIAPSWFDGCIFDTCLEELLQQLSGLPHQIILRSHPEYEKRKKKEFRKIQKLIAGHSHMRIDDRPNVLDRLADTTILITDRSGIAFEFAFGTGRPVLFIDTALKQINPDWKELNIVPIENHLRGELGISILPSQLNLVPEKIKELENYSNEFKRKIGEMEKTIFYNSASSYKAGWEFVISKIKRD